MNIREEFIKSVSEEEPHTFLHYMELHSSKNESFDVKELLQTLSRKDNEKLWTGLRDMTEKVIMYIPLGNQENQNIQSGKEPLEWPVIQSFLDGVTTMAMCVLAALEKDSHIPSSMLETAAILHGLLIVMPDGAETLQNNISQVCEMWFLHELDGKEELLTHTMPYLIIRSLSRGMASDVKRVWSLRQSLLLMDFQDNSSESLRQLLHQCMIHPIYLKLEEGRRLLSFLFGLNPDLSKEFHKTIKNQIPSCAVNVLSFYGEVYFRAWRVASGPYLQVLEETCIQDLMFCAVHAQRTGTRSMASRLRKILEYFHQQKKLRGVDEMLLRLYQPIIWRAFKVANPMVRANASALLTDAFPLQNPDAGNEEIDALLQKQFDILQELLEDPYPAVRATAVHGVCRITGVFWELIPAHIIKAFLTKLVTELAYDTSSGAVRVTVFQGLKFLLDNRLSHPLLKPLLGNLKDLIHDSSEKVRLVFVDVLLFIKGLKAIKYWNVVPLEQLLAQLEVETSASVIRRLVKLLFNSFHPTNKDADTLVLRCAALWQANPLAARKFYQYMHLHTSTAATGKFIIILWQCLLNCAKNAKNDNDSSLEDANSQAENKENTESTENVDLLDAKILSGMAETIAISWSGIKDQLDKTANEGTKTKLIEKFTKTLPKIFGTFKEPRIQAACIVIAGFLPPSSLPVFSDKCLSSLSSLPANTMSDDYGPVLNCLCAWNRVTEVMDLINDWISSHMNVSKQLFEGEKSRQRKKSVTFQLASEHKPSLALKFLAWLLAEPACRTALEGHPEKLRQIADTLRLTMVISRAEPACRAALEGHPEKLRQIADTLRLTMVISRAEPACRAALEGHPEKLRQIADTLRLTMVISRAEPACRAALEGHPEKLRQIADTLRLTMVISRAEPACRAALEGHPEKLRQIADTLRLTMVISRAEPACRAALEGHPEKLRQIADTLRLTMAIVELKLSSTSARLQTDEEFLKKAFQSYCLSEIHLHHMEKDETNAGATVAMENVLVWADRVLLTSFGVDCDRLESSQTSSGKAKRAHEEESWCTTLVCNLIEMILSSLSEMIMLGIAEEKFYSHGAVFTTSLAKHGWKAAQFISQLAKLLYQITYSALLNEDSGNMNLMEGPVLIVFSSLLQILTSCSTAAEDLLPQALLVVRPCLAEVFLLTESGRRRSGATATLMAPLVSTVITEVKQQILSAEETADGFELPRLAAFFVKMVSSSRAISRTFVSELERFVLSEASSEDIRSITAVLILLAALREKAGIGEVKNCVLHINEQLKKREQNQGTAEGDNLNAARSVLQGLLPKLQIVQ